jgi:hypothetical protein
VKKLLVILAVITIVLATASVALADDAGSVGPAPNSGDGIPDGSGF